MFLRLAFHSLFDRKGSIILTIAAISISIFVLLGIEHIRQQTKQNFSNTVSGTDLIVGARTSGINLLLYSVFRIGNPTNNIQWDTYQDISNNAYVDWAIPISLGDSHKGYRVLGTSTDYFAHFRYNNKLNLEFTDGNAFDHLFDVVLGAEVARKLGYTLGDQLTLSHGAASTSFSNHDDNPFTVVGILQPTGTPVDQTLHVSLEAIEAIHLNWPSGGTMSRTAPRTPQEADLRPKAITAFMLKLKSRMMIFRVQRELNQYTKEPLRAILPGVALTELWQTLSIMENTIRFISVFVLAAALLGMSALLLVSIRERHREIAIMRTLGASPWFIFLLIQLEAILITLLASALAISTLFLVLALFTHKLTENFGLSIDVNFLSLNNMYLLMSVFVCSVVISLIPALTAYKKALLSQVGK